MNHLPRELMDWLGALYARPGYEQQGGQAQGILRGGAFFLVDAACAVTTNLQAILHKCKFFSLLSIPAKNCKIPRHTRPSLMDRTNGHPAMTEARKSKNKAAATPAPPVPVEGQPQEPGPMIAAQRKLRKWSLTRLAEHSNVSISTISRIENGLISPTYAVLARLCEALEIRWADMIGNEEQRFARGCRAVNRAGSGVMHNTARGVYEWLGSDLATKSMEPTIVDAIPDTGLRQLEGHDGEEFLLVLEGSIVFLMQDYSPLQLDKGDSVYFDASMPHAYYGLTKPARFLTIVSSGRV